MLMGAAVVQWDKVLPEPFNPEKPKLKDGSWDSHPSRLLYNHGMKPNTTFGRDRITELAVMSGSNQIGSSEVQLLSNQLEINPIPFWEIRQVELS